MKPLASETARLLADIAVRRGPDNEPPDERLARLQKDPAALFAAINLPHTPPKPPDDSRRNVRAAITATLMPAPEPPRRKVHSQPAAVLHKLEKTAPVLAEPTAAHGESPVPFTPSASDRHEAIENWEPGLLNGQQFMVAAACCTVVLILLLQFG